MTKIKYIGSHSRYTVADITFEKDKSVELANDQVAKLKANGIGAKLFANGRLIADKATAKDATKTAANPDLKPAPKATAKTDAKADAKDKS